MDDEQGGILGAIGGGLAAIIRLLAALYGILTILFLLARITVGERLAIVAALNNVIPWLALGAAVLILPALGSRYRWLLIALQVPILAAFAVLYGPQFLPRDAPPAPADGIPVRAATYNIYSLGSDPAEIVEVLAEIDADIAGVQELGPEHAQAIEQAFADDYEALVLHPEQPANRGIGLLSRYPVRDEEVFQLTPDSLPALRATLDVDGVSVTVLVVHLPAAKYGLLPPQYDDSARNAALDALIQDYLEPESGPVLLLCDCNTAAYSDKYNELDDRLDDAFAQVGRGLGFSYGFDNAPEPPAFRIDFVWYSAAFVPQEAHGWSSSGTSDHRPMVADLVLDRRAAP